MCATPKNGLEPCSTIRPRSETASYASGEASRVELITAQTLPHFCVVHLPIQSEHILHIASDVV